MAWPKLIWDEFPISRYKFLGELYTHSAWFGVGIGRCWFIGVQWLRPKESR